MGPSDSMLGRTQDAASNGWGSPWMLMDLLGTCSTLAGELIDRVSADGSITERQAAGRESVEMVLGRAEGVGRGVGNGGGEFNLRLPFFFGDGDRHKVSTNFRPSQIIPTRNHRPFPCGKAV